MDRKKQETKKKKKKKGSSRNVYQKHLSYPSCQFTGAENTSFAQQAN